eukprot:5865619-Prorocentrum_lima.AAC.1
MAPFPLIARLLLLIILLVLLAAPSAARLTPCRPPVVHHPCNIGLRAQSQFSQAGRVKDKIRRTR